MRRNPDLPELKERNDLLTPELLKERMKSCTPVLNERTKSRSSRNSQFPKKASFSPLEEPEQKRQQRERSGEGQQIGCWGNRERKMFPISATVDPLKKKKKKKPLVLLFGKGK